MTVHFENVGRGKASWSTTMENLSCRTLKREVQPFLRSRAIDFHFSEDGTRGEIIVGGLRKVGTFRVEGGAALPTLEWRSKP